MVLTYNSVKTVDIHRFTIIPVVTDAVPCARRSQKKNGWDKRREDVLEAPYFHVVFTVPQELNSLIYSNQQLLYDALYHSVSATINELTADTKHLGARVGYICVLHTWGSEMNYHPHIHVILLGGGLTAKNQWRDKGEEFFLPVKILSKLFRGKYMDELKRLWNEKKLQFHGSSEKYRNHYAFYPQVSYACATKALCKNQTLRITMYTK